MAQLRARNRNRIAKKNFAVPKGSGKKPGTNSYPIHDRRHARNALARVSQHGTSSEKRMVRAKVARKFPGLGSATRSGGTSGRRTRRRRGNRRNRR